MKLTVFDFCRMLLLLLCLPIIVVSCQPREREALTYTADTQMPAHFLKSGSPIVIGEGMLGNPLDLMYHTKGYLVCTDNMSELMVKIIDLKTGKMQGLVQKGRGPYECLNVSCLSIVGDDIWVFGPELKKMLQLRPDSLGCFKVVNEITISDNALRCVAMRDGLFAATSFAKSRVSYYNGQGERMYETSSLPKEINLSESKAISNVVFQTDLAVSADGAKVLLANRSIDMIECYSDRGDSLFCITGPDGFRPELRKHENGGMSTFPLYPYCFAYANLRVVGDEVWASYIGQMHDGKTQMDYRNMLPNQIYCFASNGKPKRKIEIERRFISFAVKPDRSKLYCLVHAPDVSILEFDITGIDD
jgi:hypothetical protein